MISVQPLVIGTIRSWTMSSRSCVWSTPIAMPIDLASADAGGIDALPNIARHSCVVIAAESVGSYTVAAPVQW